MMRRRTIPKDGAALVIGADGDISVIMPEGMADTPPWPRNAASVLALATVLSGTDADKFIEVVGLKLKTLAFDIIERQHGIDPETATRN